MRNPSLVHECDADRELLEEVSRVVAREVRMTHDREELALCSIFEHGIVMSRIRAEIVESNDVRTGLTTQHRVDS